MFDTYSTTYTSPGYSQEVHEHRAPTDDSIRLATELREKVLQQIIHELTYNNNGPETHPAKRGPKVNYRKLKFLWGYREDTRWTPFLQVRCILLKNLT